MNARILISMVLLQGVAAACRCPEPSIDESIAGCTDIFVGRVTGLLLQRDKDSGYEFVECTFQVSERLKSGSTGTEITLQTNADLPACGYDFRLGREYLVYARPIGGHLKTSICERTKPLLDYRLKPGADGSSTADYVTDPAGADEVILVRSRLQTQKPNKAPEPTSTSVTDRADARSAPAALVAHL